MKKFTSIALALLVLVSSQGFAINTHFCGGKAVETSLSIVIQNLNCGMTELDVVCEPMTACNVQLKSKPCCENQHQIVQLDEKANIQSSSVKVNPVFHAAFIQTFGQKLMCSDQKFVHHSDYSPPLPATDIQVRFQTFLI